MGRERVEDCFEDRFSVGGGPGGLRHSGDEREDLVEAQ
jgi:hypothetical protein